MYYKLRLFDINKII